MITLHLFVTSRCHMECPLCCNRGYGVDEIPTVTVEDLKSVNILCITGGEPFLCHEISNMKLIAHIKEQYPNIKKTYVYTTGRYITAMPYKVYFDGISFGPKSLADWDKLVLLRKYIYNIKNRNIPTFSDENRLYVFPEWEHTYNNIISTYPDFVEILSLDVIHREWQEDFKPAEDSIFRRLPILL